MIASPKVSVILPCRNEAWHIEACVRSLLAQSSSVDGLELIVADGMSDDG
jgi:glycosyltransferase involved in cell wall biosynthesis